jgi:type 1 glutamine amidotransferase
MRIVSWSIIVGLLALIALPLSAFGADEDQIKAAMPSKPAVKPKKKRKLLVYSKPSGFKHGSIGAGKIMLKIMGEKTGAFEPVFNDDASQFTPAYLKKFDAVFFNNTTKVEKAFKSPEHRAALLNYVKNGGGWGGLHSASDAGGKGWMAYTEMVGGYFHGHPWGSGGTWTFNVEDPKNAIMKGFTSTEFQAKDEIYKQQFYERSKVRVLISLNAGKSKRGGRPDNDNPVVWVRDYGKGRVFYSNFGHNKQIFFDSKMLEHYLAGIQFALGDLEVETKSVPKPKAAVAPKKDKRHKTAVASTKP